MPRKKLKMCRLLFCLLAQTILCLRAANVATESALNSTSNGNTTSGEIFRPPTPPPGGAAAADPTSVVTTEAVGMGSPEATTLAETETTGAFTETQPTTAAQPVVPAEGNRFQLPVNISFLSP